VQCRQRVSRVRPAPELQTHMHWDTTFLSSILKSCLVLLVCFVSFVSFFHEVVFVRGEFDVIEEIYSREEGNALSKKTETV
jgi:hypothetical protein